MSTVSWKDRVRCYVGRHDVRSWGTLCGFCHRCQHSVMTSSGRVLYYGEFHSFPPKHRDPR